MPSKVRVITPYRRQYLHVTVSEARRRLKDKIVTYKGGQCSRCGFKGCSAAFDLHHPDPKKKDFQISGSYKSFDRLKPEIDKTELLCANCHRTVHDEINAENLRRRREELKKTAPTSW